MTDIILDEREWAENAIVRRDIGKKPIETLSRIARYYYQSEHYPKKDVRQKIEHFLVMCKPNAVMSKWADVLDGLTKDAGRYPLIYIQGIRITSSEMACVKRLEGRQVQRLAFTLLCISKYWDTVRPENNGWVNMSDSDIMKTANINTSIKRQCAMLRTLKETGLIGFSKRVDNLNIQVLFSGENGDSELYITDYRNLGNQYMMYLGEPYMQCSQCGLVVKRNSNSQKYCSDCATQNRIKKSASIAS